MRPLIWLSCCLAFPLLLQLVASSRNSNSNSNSNSSGSSDDSSSGIKVGTIISSSSRNKSIEVGSGSSISRSEKSINVGTISISISSSKRINKSSKVGSSSSSSGSSGSNKGVKVGVSSSSGSNKGIKAGGSSSGSKKSIKVGGICSSGSGSGSKKSIKVGGSYSSSSGGGGGSGSNKSIKVSGSCSSNSKGIKFGSSSFSTSKKSTKVGGSNSSEKSRKVDGGRSNKSTKIGRVRYLGEEEQWRELEEQREDKIEKLPNQPEVEFNQYSGYITVNDKEGRALFYWLTEAASSSCTKPLLLWLNGGPGCSSIAYGASEEIGPFRIHKNGSGLYHNPYSWNKVANILFLESPAGVGFSYTNTTSNLKDSGDKRTAEDAFQFLIKWFRRFPQYKNRDFYLSGESYAGHYVPQLAKLIYDYMNSSSEKFINLRGFMVGNAVTDNVHDSLGIVDFFWSHALISTQLHHAVLEHCNFTAKQISNRCQKLLLIVNKEVGNINLYNIYTSSCSSPIGSRQSLPFKNPLRRHMSGYDPCVENNAELYYNRPDVQRAFHANRTGIAYPWTACSSVLIRNWQDSDETVLPVYKELIKGQLRIWVYSGDVDSVVPVTATRYSLAQLELPVKANWYPWYHNKEVGGWTEIYEGLTFATVRGAGHEVPLFQPARAFTLFKSFLAGKPLPRK